jgi:hypothetical protein
MAALNAAYEAVRTPDRRQAYDATRKQQAFTVVPPSPATGARTRRNPDEIDFGRYQGWTIAQLAREDPDYLRWLSRHSSGIRYRQGIEEALRTAPAGRTASERVRGR